MAVNNPVAVNLGMLVVIAAGVLAYFSMPREVFPEFSMGAVTVTTLYPGATPEDVERLVTLKIEDELDGLNGLEEISSQSQEGISTIRLKVDEDRPISEFLDGVRSALARDLEFPEEVEDPLVREIVSEFPVISVFVYGTASEDVLRREAELHERAIERISGVSRVIVNGPRNPEVWIEVDPLSLERYGLTLDAIGAAVAARSQDIPLGSLKTASGEYLLRVEANVDSAEGLLDLPIVHATNGSVVRLSQVARVRDMHKRRIVRSRFNGRASMYLQVNKKSSGDTIDIAEAVYEYMDSQQARLPEGVALGSNADLSIYVKNRLEVMRNSALMGGLLVLVSLIMFLNTRVALMTALGIPVAFLGGLAIAAAVGISMNMLTMFALIVVLGMIVDDAIVVGENIYRLMEEGLSPKEAAIQGTAEVGKPVVATVLTTMAAFLPMLMLGGQMGMFMRPLPLIVTFCLAASVFEALLVLPAHLAHWSGKRSLANVGSETNGRPVRWYTPIERVYMALLTVAVRYRYVTVALALAVSGLLIGYATHQMRFNLFDEFESKVFSINLRAVPGTSMEETMEIVSELRESLQELPASELESTNSIAGISYIDSVRFEYGENLGQIWVELREGSVRTRSTSEIIASLREGFAELPPGVETLRIVQPQAGPTGAAVDLSIRGEDRGALVEIAGEVRELLSKIEGVVDIHDNMASGKREVRLSLTDEGRFLGFTEVGLARELRAAFEGTRYANLRQGDDDVEVIVKFHEELRGLRGALDGLRVSVPSSDPMNPEPLRVPLSSVARFEEQTGLLEITRDDGRGSLHVVADVNKKLTSSSEVIAQIVERFEDVPQRWPGCEIVFEGDQKETNEAVGGLIAAGTLALLVMYVILGTLFRSMTQPVVIMLAIPLSCIGVVTGHLVMQRDLSFMSLIGLLALAGVVVNDSLILIDLVNRRRQAGDGLVEAIHTAGRQRFRPILLTSVTTMLGLAPLTFFASGQARFLQPMAISVFFGLATTTILILAVIPCAYGILDDLLGFLSLRGEREEPTA
ncbi:MAG: multidrug efflux pump subunit AcrB [Pseudohongiellaceae bacterium]|jgi:multidrug efflux pump subunit AcrB